MKNFFDWLLIENNFETFQNWLQNSGMTFEELLKKLKSGRPDGIGGNAKFYKIPETEFGIRITSGSWGVPNKEPPKLAPAHDPFEGKNFGQPVAYYGNNVQVLRLQHGIPAGKPYGHDHKNVQAEEKAVQSFRERILDAANMTDSAYEQLMLQIIDLNKKGYVLDPSKSGNLLINSASDEFNIVDVNELKSNYRNNGGEIIIMLINNYFFAKHQFYLEPEMIKAGQEIINKIEKACAKTGLFLKKSSSVEHSYDLVSGHYKPYVSPSNQETPSDNQNSQNVVW